MATTEELQAQKAELQKQLYVVQEARGAADREHREEQLRLQAEIDKISAQEEAVAKLESMTPEQRKAYLEAAKTAIADLKAVDDLKAEEAKAEKAAEEQAAAEQAAQPPDVEVSDNG